MLSLADTHLRLSAATGDHKLLVAGQDRKLRVYKGTNLLSENLLLDAPTAIAVFYPEARPQAMTHTRSTAQSNPYSA